MSNKIIRVVQRDTDGSIRVKELSNVEELTRSHEQVGIDDCSTDLSLRGMPVVRGLVGPIPEAKGIVRYESAEVFESLTKEWSKTKVKRRRRKPGTPPITTDAPVMSTDSMTLT